MTSFPNGHLIIGEFSTLSEAHQRASALAAQAEKVSTASLDFRLIDVSATAAGAWVCAWVATNLKSSFVLEPGCEFVEADASLMNALLSLAPKPNEATSHVGILESSSIAEVFRSAKAYAAAGCQLIEIRIKRGGAMSGAFAYLAMTNPEVRVATAKVSPTVIKLVGDYRRFFL